MKKTLIITLLFIKFIFSKGIFKSSPNVDIEKIQDNIQYIRIFKGPDMLQNYYYLDYGQGKIDTFSDEGSNIEVKGEIIQFENTMQVFNLLHILGWEFVCIDKTGKKSYYIFKRIR